MAARQHDFAVGELANGRPAAAVAALKQAVALDRTRVGAHNDLGLALKDLGRLDEAEAAFRDASHIDTTYAAAHHNLGELLQDRGRLAEARQCFEQALGASPALNQSRIRLADTLAELGELKAAVGHYREAIALSPAPCGIYTSLGLALWRLGCATEALAAFEHSAAGSPLAAEAHYNIASALLELRRFDQAVSSAREALRLRPGFSQAASLCAAGLAAMGAMEEGIELLRHSGGAQLSAHQRYLTLAMRLMSSRLFDPARQCLDRALQEEPGDVMARHLLAALSGANPDHPLEGYVRQLFDASAATFDADLVSRLGYGIPREMVDALRAVEGAPAAPWDVLDLGCGTGLVGAEIAPHTRRLVGVDLSANMIERARRRNTYTDLLCADLMTALSMEDARDGRYDVSTAADVFIYVGKLDAVIPAVRRILKPGGLFSFSAEAEEAADGHAPQDYRLGVMGRYAHRADYLRRLAGQNGFVIELLRKTRIRCEHRRPVEGWLTIWRAI
jgi:predicted TPR repeat methyltransferase/Tfp pilus assembly protein PilF